MSNEKGEYEHQHPDDRTTPSPSHDVIKPGNEKIRTVNPLQEVLKEEPPHPWSWPMIRLYGCLWVSYLCSMTNGFDANTFGGFTAMSTFEDYFNVYGGGELGFMVTMYIIGNLVGGLFAGPITDPFGRRFGMILGSVVCIMGSVMQTSAQNKSTILAGRFFLGMGAVTVQTAGTTYAAELAHPAYRAILTGGYQSCFFIGTMTSTFIEYGLSGLSNPGTIEWRIPSILQCLPSVILLCFVWNIPETPRWLVANGKVDKAREVLIRYHGEGNPNSKLVKLELAEMEATISTHGSDKRWWDFRELFRTRASIHRMTTLLAFALFQNLIWPPTSYYMPLMLKNAGITDSRRQLLLNAVQTPVMIGGALINVLIVEHVSRRFLFMYGSCIMVATLSILTACTALQTTHPKLGTVGVVFIYLFLANFAMTWVPMMTLYASEIVPFETRAKAIALYNLAINAFSLINSYVPPVAFDNIGWKFYLFYIVFDFVGIFVVYFLFIETRKRTLEEIEEIFQSSNPVRTSIQMSKRAAREAREAQQAGDLAA
ncbi:general substrate transporter [Dacryopinax primogenitus]|uniref:General substrate transporter n=1 Tax=Dacryopinax primogenitus (strain DJM 731) TaxID=1858805 RepID=M5GAQ4_DACPD|nr:general substrate transporter [Dacryopinax primogenitus]EJU03047.1 general substrate transporter [Dacryopinax primogenitus]